MCGSEACERGIKIHGTPLGHPLCGTPVAVDHDTPTDAVEPNPRLSCDVQSAWALLLHCGPAHANYFLRVIPPDRLQRYAADHDEVLWRCLCAVSDIPEDLCTITAREASLSTCRQQQMPQSSSPGFKDSKCQRGMSESLARRPPPRNIGEVERGAHVGGWHHEAAARLEWPFPDQLMTRSTEPGHCFYLKAAQLGMTFVVPPSHPLVRLESQLFGVLLLRRLRLPLPPSSRTYRCGRLLDCFGHHRAACAQAGVLGRRGFALEGAAARICREAGGRVATNIHVRDLDAPVPGNDGRRLEVVVDGPPFYGGAEMAVDTTLCYGFALRWLSSARTAKRDAIPLDEARQRKERTYPELVQPDRRAKLVVIAGEVGGRWSDEGSLIHQALGQGTPSRVTRGFEKTCRTSVAFEVVWPPGVCGGKDVCRFPLGATTNRECRW